MFVLDSLMSILNGKSYKHRQADPALAGFARMALLFTSINPVTDKISTIRLTQDQ